VRLLLTARERNGMNRVDIDITIMYGGLIDPGDLRTYIEGAIDSYMGENYGKVQYQDHVIVVEENHGE